ncbi:MULTISPECIES: YjcZ family sporulation protein [Bacillaceae]|uniref:YjcZ family sporulation protein n=1 Tax=Metabacillus sediminis TaxID=3117746 RepID=A0ABZ2NF47_9BACI|nr:YjcZ family sporulation protein [Bacillus sp. SJS]
MSDGGYCGNNGFALVVVLFILLIIIGASYVGGGSCGSCGTCGGYGGGYGW